MDFRFTPEQEAFRAELRDFIKTELPANWDEVDLESEQAWEVAQGFQRKLAERKWLAIGWPAELGGLGADIVTQLIFHEETNYWDAPAFTMGVAWVGPAVMMYGTDQQRAQYLPRIATGEDAYCTLYSEPGAGSDLAALQTRAVLDGDEWVINGQKVWTSWAHRANLGWLAARTDLDVSKHKGISTFIVPMDAPGITIRPLINMGGQHGFNEVFFDDVCIPKENLVGELNSGWRNITSALEFERAGIEWIAKARRRLDQTLEYVKAHPEVLEHNPQLRYELAQRAIDVELGTLMCYRTVYLIGQGTALSYEASASKIYNSELTQRVAQTAMRAFGPYANLAPEDKRAPLKGQLTHSVMNGYLWASANTVGAGSSEIQRTIIATRGLGLPR